MKKSKKEFRFGFIGIGRMAELILRGMLQAETVRPDQVLVSRTSQAALNKISRELKVSVTSDNREVARACPILWIGVKPFQAKTVLSEIAPDLKAPSTVISMMAGISLKMMKAQLGPRPSLVRIMPNTASLVGDGMTGVYFKKNLSQAIQKVLWQTLRPLGAIFPCRQEQELDAITGLSGSGIAFVYAVAQGLVEGGIASGLKEAAARDIAVQTLLGAGQMLRRSPLSAAELIAQVVSKKGTTEAGLKVIQRRKLISTLAEAVHQASLRAKEIREEHDRCLP